MKLPPPPMPPFPWEALNAAATAEVEANRAAEFARANRAMVECVRTMAAQWDGIVQRLEKVERALADAVADREAYAELLRRQLTQDAELRRELTFKVLEEEAEKP